MSNVISRTRMFDIPYPTVTGNHTTRHTKGGGHYLSASTVSYRAAVAMACRAQGVAGLRLAGPLQVDCLLVPPDRRNRDLENSAKVFLDALVKAGVLLDDGANVIRRLSLEWSEPMKDAPALVHVTVTEL